MNDEELSGNNSQFNNSFKFVTDTKFIIFN